MSGVPARRERALPRLERSANALAAGAALAPPSRLAAVASGLAGSARCAATASPAELRGALLS